MPGRTRKAPPARKHPLRADGSIPPDFLGRYWCLRCRVMGRPGDVRHTDEFPETPDGDRSAQILGEG